jgi:DnaJ-class molecular chaperone
VYIVDPYKILDIDPLAATPKDIKKAYRKKAKYYHPDLNKDKDAEKNFIRVVAAYEALTASKSKPAVEVKVRTKRKTEPPRRPTKEEKKAQKEEAARRMREEIRDILYAQQYARRFDSIIDLAMVFGGIGFMILLYYFPILL